MPYCTRCGQAVEDNQAFCTKCGSNLSAAGMMLQGGSQVQGSWENALEPGESLVFQCSDAKIWAKESYGSIAGRHIGNFADASRVGVQKGMAAAYGDSSDTRRVQRQESEMHRQQISDKPNLPRHSGTVLLVSDKRLLLFGEEGGLDFGLALDPVLLRGELEGMVRKNQEAFSTLMAVRAQHKGLFSTFNDVDIHKYGAEFAFTVLLSSELRNRTGGGQELELKLDVLNLAKQMKDVSWNWRRSFNMEASSRKRDIRGYGLRFKEEDKAPEINKYLQGRASAIRDTIMPYQ